MYNKNSLFISFIITTCIILNFIGKIICYQFRLPISLDSVGTILTAYLFGPICSIIVAIASFLIIGMFHTPSFFYVLPNITIGVIIGICVQKNKFKDFFGVLSVSFLLTISCVLISTPLNYLLNEGYTHNVWGNGVIDLLNLSKFNPIISMIIGELYVDFLDKLVIILAFYFIIKWYRKIKLFHLLEIEKKHTRRKKFHILLFFITVLVVPTMFTLPVNATDDNSRLHNFTPTIYNENNGLISGTANTIAQSLDGVLWIGTSNGIYRYNGKEFQSPSSLNAIRNINCIYADEEGRLWIGTNDNGLFLCINEKIVNTLNKTNGLTSDTIQCIMEHDNGDYYIGTDKNLMIVSISRGLSVTYIFPEITNVKNITTNNQGEIAATTAAGELFLIEDHKISESITCPNSSTKFTCSLFDENGDLFIGTTMNEIYKYHIVNHKLTNHRNISTNENYNINSMHLNDNHSIIICSEQGIASLEKDFSVENIRINQFNTSIKSMMNDYQGNLWFCSSVNGLLKLCKSNIYDIFTKTNLPEETVCAITKWNKNLYYGTNNGLYITDHKATTQANNFLTETLKNIPIQQLYVDSYNQLWISTIGKGVLKVTTNEEIINFNEDNGLEGNSFVSILETKDKNILIGSDEGLFFIKDNKIHHHLTKTNFSNCNINSLIELEDGTILAGTEGNGITIIQNNKVSNTLTKADGLTSDFIVKLKNDINHDGIYVITSNGLCYMNSKYNIEAIEHFPYNDNYDIIPTKNENLFVISSAGIFIIDHEDLLLESPFDYRLLDYHYGFTNDFTKYATHYQGANDNLILATTKGAIHIQADDYKKEFYSYRIKLPNVKVGEQTFSINRGETINIPSGINQIEFTPEIINYSANNPKISIFFEGLDLQPKIINLNDLTTLTYTNIPTGDYTFILSILNGNNEVVAEREYPIHKEKEIYDNWWFLTYFITVFSLIFIYLSWMIFRTQIQKTLKLQRQELALARRQMEMIDAAVLTIAQTVDAKDPYTSQHSSRVSDYSVLIADKLGYTPSEKESLRKTALLHDIGKISIPDHILNKPSRLTDEEYSIMKMHVTKGGEILDNFSFVDNIVEGAKYHHERYDGNGYVSRLRGENIPLNARIIGIADAFDAMTSNRIYRNHLDGTYVLNELKKGKGSQFDPKLVDIMLELIDEGAISINPSTYS